MAKVKFYKINNSALNSLPVVEGQLIFVQDTGKMYIDINGSTRKQVEGLSYTAGTGISISGATISNSGVRSISESTSNGKIKVNTGGTETDVAVHGLGDLAFKDNIAASNITSGTLGVNRGGTGASSFTSGNVLIGNGTSAIGTRAIDTTTGGTASSNSLITSGAVNAGLATKLDTSLKGANSGLAELDENGLVPASQLPSYVDDIIELLNVTSTAPSTCSKGDRYYNSSSKKIFTATGTNTWGTTGENPETGKIYVNLNNNKTYRWSGSDLVVISETLALGETSSTAYRGDRGATAYTHATDANRLTTATASGLYKIAATAYGHVQSLTAVEKADITGLGIPGSDTKNTAGSTDTSSKIYLIGATSQAANPQTYSDNEVFATNGVLQAKEFSVAAGANIVYNSTNKCIEFNFA